MLLCNSHTRDEYTFDAAYDISRNAAFLSAGKRQNDTTAVKVSVEFPMIFLSCQGHTDESKIVPECCEASQTDFTNIC